MGVKIVRSPGAIAALPRLIRPSITGGSPRPVLPKRWKSRSCVFRKSLPLNRCSPRRFYTATSTGDCKNMKRKTLKGRHVNPSLSNPCKPSSWIGIGPRTLQKPISGPTLLDLGSLQGKRPVPTRHPPKIKLRRTLEEVPIHTFHPLSFQSRVIIG